MRTAADRLVDAGYEDVVVFENPGYDNALIGVTSDDRAVYDFDKMVEGLMAEYHIDQYEAIEWIEYNAVRALPYVDGSPVIVYRLED